MQGVRLKVVLLFDNIGDYGIMIFRIFVIY